MRRLNRIEYDNTVRDLLGTTQQLGRGFLNDAPQFGFDNNADQQTLSPVQFEMYQAAAEVLASEALKAPARGRLVSCDLASGDVCLRTVATSLGTRAFRRPLLEEEIASSVALAAKARTLGASADEALATVIEALLVSPHFLFRVEIDADPASPTFHPLNPYETATRLSYLIYRSMPDAALFEAAAAGKLADPKELQEQVARMLTQPAGSTFARDFAGQWLGTRLLETAQFDPTLFPRFTPALAGSMRAEVSSFFEEFVRDNRPVRELLTANFSYLDATLAQHYGISGVTAGLTRTSLTTPERSGGLLTMAGALAVTSPPTRSSIVRRGHWVMQEMLCAQPPPPPPDVDGFPEGPLAATTQRQLLALHRQNPACNSCHVEMDNIGVALEQYDAIGGHRTTDAGIAIDARGTLPNGATFNGAKELASVLAADPRFAPCVAKHMLSYALGRTIGVSDQPYLQQIASGADNSVGLRDLVMNIVASETFRLRRGEPSIEMGAQP